MKDDSAVSNSPPSHHDELRRRLTQEHAALTEHIDIDELERIGLLRKSGGGYIVLGPIDQLPRGLTARIRSCEQRKDQLFIKLFHSKKR